MTRRNLNDTEQEEDFKIKIRHWSIASSNVPAIHCQRTTGTGKDTNTSHCRRQRGFPSTIQFGISKGMEENLRQVQQ